MKFAKNGLFRKSSILKKEIAYHVIVSPVFLLALEILGEGVVPVDVLDVGNGGVILK
jgi:hypothetical protein